MCGACRVSVGGETRFACVDGPEFDGHQVDWDELMARQASTARKRPRSLEQWKLPAAGTRQGRGGPPWLKPINNPHTKMPRQNARGSGIHNFEEVALGYTLKWPARRPAAASVQEAHCVGGCPVASTSPPSSRLLREATFAAAAATIKEKNVLPGRLRARLPAGDQCEAVCTPGQDRASPSPSAAWSASWPTRSGNTSLRPKCRAAAAHRQEGGHHRLRPGRPDRAPATWPGGATRSPSSRRCTSPAAC